MSILSIDVCSRPYDAPLPAPGRGWGLGPEPAASVAHLA